MIDNFEQLNDFELDIKKYLDKIALTDEAFSKAYSNPDKNLHDCYLYVSQQAQNHILNESGVITDVEVHEWAKYYYEEDNIEITWDGNEVIKFCKPEENWLDDEDDDVVENDEYESNESESIDFDEEDREEMTEYEYRLEKFKRYCIENCLYYLPYDYQKITQKMISKIKQKREVGSQTTTPEVESN